MAFGHYGVSERSWWEWWVGMADGGQERQAGVGMAGSGWERRDCSIIIKLCIHIIAYWSRDQGEWRVGRFYQLAWHTMAYDHERNSLN